MQLKDFTISNLFDLNETIAAELFEGKTYPWEVLGDISDFIIALGNKLPQDRFEKRGENIWVAKSATVFDSAYIGGPCIIDENATVRQCAFIRGSAIVGNGTTVGNSTEPSLQLCGRQRTRFSRAHGRRLHYFQCKSR